MEKHYDLTTKLLKLERQGGWGGWVRVDDILRVHMSEAVKTLPANLNIFPPPTHC